TRRSSDLKRMLQPLNVAIYAPMYHFIRPHKRAPDNIVIVRAGDICELQVPVRIYAGRVTMRGKISVNAMRHAGMRAVHVDVLNLVRGASKPQGTRGKRGIPFCDVGTDLFRRQHVAEIARQILTGAHSKLTVRMPPFFGRSKGNLAGVMLGRARIVQGPIVGLSPPRFFDPRDGAAASETTCSFLPLAPRN